MLVFIISILYIAVSLAVGIVFSRRNKNSQDFFVAKDHLTLPLACAMLLASTFAGAYTSGSVRDAYVSGFAPYLPLAAMGIGYIFSIPYLRFLRSMGKEGYISIPEIIEVRFGSGTKGTILVLNCIAYAATFAVQPIAFASIVAPMLNLNITVVAVGALVVMVAMALCGLTGVAWMNMIHSLVMLVGLILISVVSMGKAGGLESIIQTVPSDTWNIFVPSASSIIISFLVLVMGMMLSPEIPTIAIGSKGIKTAKLTCLIIGIVICIFSAFILMIGVSAQILTPGLEEPSSALYVLSSQLGPIFSIIASVAILAAITSSAPAYLIYFSASVTRYATTRFMPKATEKTTKIFSAICIIVIAVVGFLFALKLESILNFLFYVFEVASISGILLIIGYKWKRVSERSAFLGVTLTSVFTITWLILDCPFGIRPSLIVLVLGVLSIVGFTLLEKEPVSKGYLRMKEIMDKHKDDL